MKVRYSPRALSQLQDIHRYIAKRNPRAASNVIARIEELCERLGEFPGMGYISDHPDVRVLPVVKYPYLIFYSVIAAGNEVRILRVRHGRRRPLARGDVKADEP
jgi:addiction module RelE/StbE family toxin